MSYMEQVAKILGVELGEEFYLKEADQIRQYPYKLTVDGMFVQMRGVWSDKPMTLARLLRGNLSVVKKPRRPKIGETYYFIDVAGFINQVSWGDDFCDAVHYKNGNCFKTREEAEANTIFYLQWLEAEPITDWRK